MAGTKNLAGAKPDEQSRYHIQQARKHVLDGLLEGACHHYAEALLSRECSRLRSEYAGVLAQTGRIDQALECYTLSEDPAAREFLSAERFCRTRSLTRLACIYFYGRSGSAFLQSLLDDHPQVITVAGVYLQGFYQFWLEYGAQPQPELVNQFCEIFSPMFRADRPSRRFGNGELVYGGELLGLTHMGPDRELVLELDEERFRSELVALTSVFPVLTSRYFFQSVHAAYWLAQGRSLQGKEVIVFQSHFAPVRGRRDGINHRKSERLLLDFPASYHIFTLRSPLATLGSYIIHALRPEHQGYFRTTNIAGYLAPEILLGGESLDPSLQGASIGVKLEDLHADGASVMRALSAWLKLSWDDRLLSSTFHGVQWWNVAHSPVVSGFNQTVLTQKREQHFTAFDTFRLKVLLAPKFRAWNYALPSLYGSGLLRILVLPLLFFLFRMELTSWRAFRSDASLPLRILTFVKGYVSLRKSCLQAWFESWGASRREVRVLQPIASQAL